MHIYNNVRTFKLKFRAKTYWVLQKMDVEFQRQLFKILELLNLVEGAEDFIIYLKLY